MKQNALNSPAPVEVSRTGLISLKSLQAATEQMQTPKRHHRITVVSCDPETKRTDPQDQTHDIARV